MARKHSIKVADKEKEFLYTLAERSFLETKYETGLMELLRSKFMPVDEKDRPTGGGVWSVQVDVLHQGLKHLGGAVSRDRVSKWMINEANNSDSGIIPWLASAYTAILESGVLGMKFVVSTEDEETEGKGEETETAA